MAEGDRESAQKVVSGAVSGEESEGTYMSIVGQDGEAVPLSVDMGPRRVRGEQTRF